MKRFLAVFLLFMIAFGAVGCSLQQKQDEWTPLFDETLSVPQTNSTVILLTMTEKESSFTYACALQFKSMLEEMSDGAFTVDLFADNTLGSLRVSDQMLMEGRVQLRLGPGPSKLMHLLGLPSLSGCSTDSIPKVMADVEWKALLDEECLEQGVRILGVLPSSYRVVTSNQEIRSLRDFQNLRLRYIGSASTEAIWEPVGSELVRVLIDNDIAAISSDLVDAWTDNTLLHFLASERYHVQKYVIETKHQIYLEPFYVNERFYQSLTREEKQLLNDAIEKTIAWAEEEYPNWIAKRLPKADAAGVQFISFTESEIQKMYRTNYQATYDLMEGILGTDRLLKGMEILQSIAE